MSRGGHDGQVFVDFKAQALKEAQFFKEVALKTKDSFFGCHASICPCGCWFQQCRLLPLRGEQKLSLLLTRCSQLGGKAQSREASHADLSAYLRESRKEVESAIKPNDPRWMDFIEKTPGVLHAPEAVSALVAEPGLPGHIRLSFLPALRAEAYGVYVSHGEGQPFLHVATVHDTVADLILTPGADVRIRVKASNAAGQSAPSPIAEVTVPVALAEAA